MTKMVDLKVMDKVVNLDAQGVANSQIAEAIGISVDVIQAWQDREDYQKKLLDLKTQTIEKDKHFDDQWDSIEKRAIDIVRDNLKHNLDPNFALKAALLANKAIRRGRPGNTPLNGSGGPKAVITLNQVFIARLQNPPAQMGELTAQQINHQNQLLDGSAVSAKVVNMLNPKEVEQLLVYKKKTDEDGMITDIDLK